MTNEQILQALALSQLERLRTEVSEGRVLAFACVALDEFSDARLYTSGPGDKSAKLAMQGAIQLMSQRFLKTHPDGGVL